MKAGKLAPKQLERLVLGRFAHRRSDVLVPAGLGEDSAVIDFGDEVCLLSTDPITGVGRGAGRLAVHVSCNDIAANGGHPIGVQVVLLLPEGTEDSSIIELMDGVECACAELGIEVLGGHTEITSRVTAPLVVTTAVGRAPKNRYVTSAGARPGDAVVVTKGVGIEGTAILAAEWADTIRRAAIKKHLEAETDTLEALLCRAKAFAEEISAVNEGVAAASFGVSAMHDVTEGGLYGALYEIGKASRVGFRIEAAKVPIRPETAFICDCLELDPLGLISSGTMLITCPDGGGLVEHLVNAGVPAFVIGEVGEQPSLLVLPNAETQLLPQLPEDELWRFLASSSKFQD
ncbi:MAG: AIR synthase family protein [Limnochordia bacterium]|jgi:hydrogenase expression/formation protein HypE